MSYYDYLQVNDMKKDQLSYRTKDTGPCPLKSKHRAHWETKGSIFSVGLCVSANKSRQKEGGPLVALQLILDFHDIHDILSGTKKSQKELWKPDLNLGSQECHHQNVINITPWIWTMAPCISSKYYATGPTKLILNDPTKLSMSRSQLREHKQICQTSKSDRQEWQSLVVLNGTNFSWMELKFLVWNSYVGFWTKVWLIPFGIIWSKFQVEDVISGYTLQSVKSKNI